MREVGIPLNAFGYPRISQYKGCHFLHPRLPQFLLPRPGLGPLNKGRWWICGKKKIIEPE